MKRKDIYDPYVEILTEFNKSGVKYVIVDMSGINYYASSASEIFSTQDYDVFLKPSIENTKRAISILKELEYSLSSCGKEIEIKNIKGLIKNRETIIGVNFYGVTIELILTVSGYTFNQMECDAAIFNVANVPIKVGKLKKLLMSKKIAGRTKDKYFLKRFKILLEEKGE